MEYRIPVRIIEIPIEALEVIEEPSQVIFVVRRGQVSDGVSFCVGEIKAQSRKRVDEVFEELF